MTEARPLIQVNASCPGSTLQTEMQQPWASKHLCENIPEVQTYYNSTGYGDELLWAASWLYHATGDDSYLEFVTGQDGEDYAQWGSPTWFSWDNKLAGTQAIFEYTSEGIDEMLFTKPWRNVIT
ncbi:hypothetical protein Fmac_018155 [Flemingia macrophylla]|uniref:cellulase n=1 Tax=Flemingia macrophylla TaxID=520843 RepID=A0ABD1M461_9FABA